MGEISMGMKGRILARLVTVFAFAGLFACTKKDPRPSIWIYTSLYKDTVADLQPRLEARFPGYSFHFFQSGSEEVAAKVNAEELAGGTLADILIFSDRFWFEEMARKNRLLPYATAAFSPEAARVPATLRHPDGAYAAVSIPLMVLIYNSSAVPEAQAPKTFREMAEPKWKGKFTTGSPLASGTNFTTVAFLQKEYGWDYFKALRRNDTLSEGGNGAVMRRVQTKERPVGWILLENVLRLKPDSPIRTVYPDDGAIVQANNLGIIRKREDPAPARAVADWFFGADGQAAMVRSYMYAAVPGYDAPKGARKLDDVLAKAPKWTPERIEEFLRDRESMKETFAEIMFQ